ncbi:MAG: glycosyltransferase family A protein [Puia sp.]|nr:glycosyltransferase family A protein [Puia sp.]
MTKYSIILPVRNGGDYVKTCVAGILAQSYRDFHLLVLDNCSTDGTLEWLQSLSDQRIRVYPSKKPLSIEENWGRITGLPKNEFITLIGHDDLLDPHYLTVMDRLIQNHPQATLFQAHFRYIDSGGSLIRRCKPMDERQSPAEFLSFFLANNIDNMGTGYMMRSKDYDAAGGIPPYPNLLFADFELWTELTLPGYKATAFEECFAFRLHQSMTTGSSDWKFQLAFGRFIEYLEKTRDRHPQMAGAISRYAVDFIRNYCKGLSHRLLRTPLRKRNGQTIEDFTAKCSDFADRLVPGNDFDPYKLPGMRLARSIDRYWFFRALFLLFKRIYSKPVLT